MENYLYVNMYIDMCVDDKSIKIVRLLGLIGGVLIAFIIYYAFNV